MLDAADPNALLALNALLANGHTSIADRTPETVTRHADHVVIATCNTWAGGDAGFSGRESQDEALRDRFRGGFLRVGFCREIESHVAPADVCEHGWALRKKARDVGLTDQNGAALAVGTRAFIAAAKLRALGRSMDDAWGAALADWDTRARDALGLPAHAWFGEVSS